MLSVFLFAFMICGALSENINCQFKPGCDVNHCDPSPSSWNKLGFNIDEYLQKKQFPITCESQKKKSSDDVQRPNAENSENLQEIKELKEEIIVLRKESNEFRKETKDLQRKLEEKLDDARKEANQLKNDIIQLREKVKDLSDFKKEVTKTSNGLNKNQSKRNQKDKSNNCDVEYNLKCFRAIVHPTFDTNFNAARKICNEMGWGVANIYDVTHYRLLEKLLRQLIPSGQTWMQLWTGMTLKNKEVHLTSGGEVTLDGVLYPGFPYLGASSVNIVVRINKNQGYQYQGVLNRSTDNSYQGVICEV